ncbi:uncharacterized protein LOC129753060 [Uranotaenia lowii]|uniref:uncharacterized protein LOC129753060 n=1 Tax=Uranotaenia lowii TaxID=190385 RepID=UPI002479C87D|nr:uncharacterized protein LOC129753060 [Uranotaenia lowii]
MPTFRAPRFTIPQGFSTVLHNEAVPPTENPGRTCVQQNESNQRIRDIGQLPDKQFPAAYAGVGAASNPYGIHGVGPTDNSQPQQAPNSWAYPAAGLISAQQIAARQVVSRDLPKFSGDPLEWPMFVNAFESTTRMCGIQPDENLVRLQRALIGNAREKVLSILTIPSAVPQIITTLRDECGRPDQLVNCLLTRVRTATQPNANKLGTLVTFGREVRNLVAFMEAAQLHSYLSSPILLTEMVSKLPPCLQLQWGHYLMSVPVPNLEAFCNFISTIRTAAFNVSTATESSIEVSAKREKRKEKVGGFLNAHQEVTVKPENPKPCLACDSVGHKIRECDRFRKLSVSERWKKVERKKMCRRCLFPHGKLPCRTKYPCGVDGCSEAHHKLLHSTKRSDLSEAQSGTSGTVSTHRHSQDKTLFKILPVRLFGNGKSVAAFAFLDDGSDLTLIENEAAEELGLEGTESPLCLEWTNNVTRNENSSRRVNLAIAKINGGEKHLLTAVRTVRNLGLPKQTINYPDLVKLYPHLRGLPVESYNEATPSILIGVDHARLTRLGWVVFGGRGLTAEQSRARVNVCSCAPDEHLEDIVREFVSSDTIGIQGQLPPECEEDMRARKILEETTVRTASGRIQTGLLWRSDCVKLPNSYHMAKKRNDCLERRLAKDPELKANITKQIPEYQQRGYAHIATEQELRSSNPDRTWYLPIGVVRHPRKPGKVRVIWDAAARVDGVSLNSALLKGPDLLTPLLSVLFRFREKQFAVAGDITQMFHQLLICPEDRQAQRFLWRSSPEAEPEVYVIDVATFGATCSPCSAQYAKNLNAREHQEKYPDASEAIINETYVDDFFDSRDTVAEVVKLAQEVSIVNRAACFEIPSWQSNSHEVLRQLGGELVESDKCFSAVQTASSTDRVLGIVWKSHEDIFVFDAQFREDLKKTCMWCRTFQRWLRYRILE